MTNRLINETSPYLLQHAHNPVDWFPWGEEAFAKAKAEDKPVLVSIGYAACHWCHVMERESFEDEDIAAAMNERFVAIKVDREERPDVDAIYMRALQNAARPGRVAAQRVPAARRQALLRRHVFPQRKPARHAVVAGCAPSCRGRVRDAPGRGAPERGCADGSAPGDVARRRGRIRAGGVRPRVRGAGLLLRRRAGRVRLGPEIPSGDGH